MTVVLWWLVCNENVNAAVLAPQGRLVFREHASVKV